MNKTSLFSGIALVTVVLGLGMASPMVATSVEPRSPDISTGFVSGHSELLQTPPSELIAARRCFLRRVYHKGHSSRRFGIVGRKTYHPGYYTTKRVCH
ncbi:hypothetical protein [Nostoc sp.]